MGRSAGEGARERPNNEIWTDNVVVRKRVEAVWGGGFGDVAPGLRWEVLCSDALNAAHRVKSVAAFVLRLEDAEPG